MYIEVTDTEQIVSAQEAMQANLKKQFPYRQKRVIGWPSGHFEGEVRFTGKRGGETNWWYTGFSEDEQSAYNLFGRGDPETSQLLLIDLQFNFPIDSFNRKQGGVFVQDVASGKVILGHRGIVTRGKSRVPRELLLQEADVTPVTIASEEKPNQVNVLLISPIDNASLGKQISEFATEIRRAAYLVMDPNHVAETAKKKKSGSSPAKSPLDAALSDYFDEFTGKTVIRRSSQVTMNCRHGSVVKALREALEPRGTVYKSQAIDLAVETEKEVLLYEVKTGSDSQSIYTGIGQLYFHAAALTRKFRGKKVIRHLVIPYAPAAANREKVCKELGIEIITFTTSSKRIDLPEL
ncbi:hypothetical protein FEF65_02765 [Mariprofundus erugo]|uniref:Uncharacterized protein n=1 Tax=Mariprofundus erugo TaxID=2528639 RepID=A0A5R9GUG5_9PROT|nr:hypothetical protein [Mariprofundus erugo]TLS68645.1 hypothetical protein FEF65_02765 [Mariprofundus erugo]